MIASAIVVLGGTALIGFNRDATNTILGAIVLILGIIGLAQSLHDLD